MCSAGALFCVWESTEKFSTIPESERRQEMTNTDARVEALLNSLVGCEFLVTAVESGLSPEDLADPKISLWLAAASVESVNIHYSDHKLLASELPPRARENANQAREIIEHPGTAWWFDDIDLDAQTWVSIDWTDDHPHKFIYGTQPNTMAWTRPRNPSSEWERYAQQPSSNQNQTTSTLYDDLTSELVAYANRTGDYHCDFPLARWSIRFLEEVRVFEIHGPADWYDLCVRYPAKDTEDARLVPNWGAVAEEWDGVHLSIGGLLTTEQHRHESAAGWTMLNFWHAEQTYWLRPLKTESERQSDFGKDMGFPEIEGYRPHDIGWDTGTLLTSDEPLL